MRSKDLQTTARLVQYQTLELNSLSGLPDRAFKRQILAPSERQFFKRAVWCDFRLAFCIITIVTNAEGTFYFLNIQKRRNIIMEKRKKDEGLRQIGGPGKGRRPIVLCNELSEGVFEIRIEVKGLNYRGSLKECGDQAEIWLATAKNHGNDLELIECCERLKLEIANTGKQT
jgi:hypothetical protein